MTFHNGKELSKTVKLGLKEECSHLGKSTLQLTVYRKEHILSVIAGATHTMMLLMGMWMSFTKNPMNPITANPIAVAVAMRWNSAETSHRML